MPYYPELGGGSGSTGVTAANTIEDNAVVRGDGGARGIQGGPATLADDGTMASTYFQAEVDLIAGFGGGGTVIIKKDASSGTQDVGFITTDRNYSWPDASGTVALLSNITGGTSTGSFTTLAVALGAGFAPPTNFSVGDTSAATTRGILNWQASTDTGSAHLHLRKSRGTFAAPTTVVTGDLLGRVIGSGYDGASFLQMASIDFMSTGTIGTNRLPTQIRFRVGTDASPSVLTQALLLGADNSATFAGALSGITTLSLSGQLTSTLATGTAPFSVASTTNVANLNASSLNGATFSAPGAIGGGTPSTGAFTTLSASTSVTTPLLTGGGNSMIISPTSGVSKTVIIKTTSSGGAEQSNMTFNADGTVSTISGISSGGNVSCASTSGLLVSGRLTLVASANGKAVLSNAAQTAGVMLDVSTDSALQLQVRAGGTDANLTANLKGQRASAPTIASAGTIAPVSPVVFISGVATISTITVPSTFALGTSSAGGGTIILIPTGIFATDLLGNIALASTAVVGKALSMTWDSGTGKWYPSY